MKVLEKLKVHINVPQLYEKLGQLLAQHMACCKSQTTDIINKKLPEESSVTEKVREKSDTSSSDSSSSDAKPRKKPKPDKPQS